MSLVVSHNIACRRRYPNFYENVDIIRLNSPYYSKEELEGILKNENKPKFVDINIQIRLKQVKQQHDFQTLLKLIGKYDVEWVGISNVEKEDTYDYIKKILNNDKTKICAKIETEKGCRNSYHIIKRFDGILVDTEDLAFDMGWTRAIEEKNRIYGECEKYNVPHFRLMGTIFEYKSMKKDKLIIKGNKDE